MPRKKVIAQKDSKKKLKARKKLITLIVPVYNEEQSVFLIYKEIMKVWKDLAKKYQLEILFVNDGSIDQSQSAIKELAGLDKQVRYLEFSRNFGKEVATSAGLHHAHGDAAVMIDADLQHPPRLIKQFLKHWEKGFDMVVGVRTKNKGESLVKGLGSKLFYKLISQIGETEVLPSATDFRLIDREIIDQFNLFTERNRITRGLIDWLGFNRKYVYFKASERKYGKASYNFWKLLKLAFSTFTAHSLFPLKVAGYLGICITLFSGSLGIFIIIENLILNDPWHLNFSGPAMLAVFMLFLIGIVLICLGLIALYVGNIHAEVINRPMYVVRDKKIK